MIRYYSRHQVHMERTARERLHAQVLRDIKAQESDSSDEN